MNTVSTMRIDCDALLEMKSSCACGASTRPQAAIEAQQLSFERDGRLILDTTDLSIARGQIVAVLGANGAGKTTLLRCLAGLLRPATGEVRWLGQLPQNNTALRRSIGMVAHQDWLYGELTPRQNMLFSARMYGVANAKARTEELLSEAGLLQYANKAADRLSHGMRRRVSVCRAMVHDPPILLFDEPFSGLDDQGQSWLQGLLAQLRSRSRAICLTTHAPDQVLCVSDRLVRLEKGKLHNVEVAGGDSSPAHFWEAAA